MRCICCMLCPVLTNRLSYPGFVRRLWTRSKSSMKLATWPIFLFFALCWLVLGVAACMTAYTWAKSIEKARRENAVHVASELARFLGTEIERFFVPLYPLRMFVERTRLIELSRIAQDFPDRDAGTSLFKDTSSLSEHPEVLSDFNTTMEGIWGALVRTAALRSRVRRVLCPSCLLLTLRPRAPRTAGRRNRP